MSHTNSIDLTKRVTAVSYARSLMLRYCLVLLIIPMLAQHTFGQKTIYGTVIDANTREPLPYANVFVNNTTMGTVTNEDGKYRLVIPEGEYQIVFSFIGY